MVAPYAAAEAALLMQPPLPYHPNRLPFFCKSLKGFILSALFVAALLFAVRTFSHPAAPTLSVASASLSSISIAGECNISLNRRLTASYDRMEISLLYDHAKLSQLHHPRIVQLERSQIALEANLAFSGLDLGDDVASALKQELDRGGLELVIEVFAELKYWNIDQKSGSTQYMRAYCGGVTFNFTSSNMTASIFLNPYQECKLYFYSK